MTCKKSLRKFRKGKLKMTTQINPVSGADSQYYQKVIDQDGNESYVAVTVPIGKTETGKKSNKLTDEELDAMINQAKENLKSDDEKTRKEAEKELKDLYRQKGYSKKAAEIEAERDVAVYRAELRKDIENDRTEAALANLNSEDKKTRKNAEKELEEEYKNALMAKGYSKKEAKRTAKQYITESKAGLNIIDDDAQLKASEDLKSDDKKTRKNAEKTLEEQYKNKLIVNHYSEKSAEKTGEKLVQDDRYKIRFDNRTTFVNKEEYEAARKAAKENGEDTKDLALLSKQECEFVAEHPELFYDEDGNYSSDKGKDYVRTKSLQNQDYKLELKEADAVAEEYGSTRKVQVKLAKSFGAETENDNTGLYRGLYVVGTTLTGTAVGAGVGKLASKTAHVNTVQTAAAGVDGTAAVVEDIATSITDLSVDSSNVATAAGGAAGAIGGLVFGLATMKKNIKDYGEGDVTQTEQARQYVSEKPAEEEPVQEDIQPVDIPEEELEETPDDDEDQESDCKAIAEPYTETVYADVQTYDIRGKELYHAIQLAYNIPSKDMHAAVGLIKEKHNISQKDRNKNVGMSYLNLEKEITINGRTYTRDDNFDVNKVRNVTDYGQNYRNSQGYNPTKIKKDHGKVTLSCSGQILKEYDTVEEAQAAADYYNQNGKLPE